MGAAGGSPDDEQRGARAMGAAIRTLRGHTRMSQVALGRRTQMHANYLGAIERGEIRSPGLDTVDRIARGLDVSIAVLAGSYAAAPGEPAPPVDATSGRPGRRAGGHDAKALGKAVRLVRRRLGLTQAQLGEASGLHRNHVGSVEVGEKPTRSITTIARIARGLESRLGGGGPRLLPLFAQAFNGELTPAHVRGRIPRRPSGSSVARSLPPGQR